MCKHDESKKTTYLECFDALGYEVYLCECGALINILAPQNSHDPVVPMAAEEIREMALTISHVQDIERLREIAERKAAIWDEDRERGCGLLIRKDNLALEYQELTKERHAIMYKLVGPNFWKL